MNIINFFNNKIAYIFFFTLFLMIFSRFLIFNAIKPHINKENTTNILNEHMEILYSASKSE
jgi:hypothetical protein